jgi:hypothetical protein
MYRKNGVTVGKRQKRMTDSKGFEKAYVPGRARRRTLAKRAAKRLAQ